jgi:hypothetical protein
LKNKDKKPKPPRLKERSNVLNLIASGVLERCDLLVRGIEPLNVKFGFQVENAENTAKNFKIYADARLENSYHGYKHDGRVAEGVSRTAYKTKDAIKVHDLNRGIDVLLS